MQAKMKVQPAIRKPATPIKKAGWKRRKPGGTTWTRAQGNPARKQKWFDAFGAQKKLVAPEKGIHSLEWARNIAPQNASLLLSLPLEVRQRIFNYALIDSSNPGYANPILNPRKHGKKFINQSTYDVVNTYTAISLVSRQTYIEIVGSGLLHKNATFTFVSHTGMSNYLTRINPSLRIWIIHVDLIINLTQSQRSIPNTVFTSLLSLKALKHLNITLDVRYISHVIFGPYNAKGQISKLSQDGEKMYRKIEGQQGWVDLRELRLKEFDVKFRGFNNWRGGCDQNYLERYREFRKRVGGAVMGKVAESK